MKDSKAGAMIKYNRIDVIGLHLPRVFRSNGCHKV